MFFVLIASTVLHAQTKKSNNQVLVNQSITKFFDALATLDTNVMKQYCTTDFLLLEDGEVWNLDTLANKLRPFRAMSFSRTNHLNFIRTQVKGTTAWVAYHNAADMVINGQKMNVQWLESAVLVKVGNEWRIQLLHSTPLNSNTK